jgi:hypothetical protein
MWLTVSIERFVIASGAIVCEYISEAGKDQKRPEREIDKVHRVRARFA